MRQRVTVSLTTASIGYVDRQVGRKLASRSAVIESMIKESQRRRKEESLSRRAHDFFQEELSQAEIEERQAWLSGSLETMRRER